MQTLDTMRHSGSWLRGKSFRSIAETILMLLSSAAYCISNVTARAICGIKACLLQLQDPGDCIYLIFTHLYVFQEPKESTRARLGFGPGGKKRNTPTTFQFLTINFNSIGEARMMQQE